MRTPGATNKSKFVGVKLCDLCEVFGKNAIIQVNRDYAAVFRANGIDVIEEEIEDRPAPEAKRNERVQFVELS